MGGIGGERFLLKDLGANKYLGTYDLNLIFNYGNLYQTTSPFSPPINALCFFWRGGGFSIYRRWVFFFLFNFQFFFFLNRLGCVLFKKKIVRRAKLVLLCYKTKPRNLF